MQADVAMITLAQCRGIGPVGIRKLLSSVGGDPRKIWQQSEQFLLAIPGVNRQQVAALQSADSVKAQVEYDTAKSQGIAITSYGSEDYPEGLEHLHDPPPVLYIKGEIGTQPAIAIVGTRRPSYYGKRQAYRLARELAGRGITIVSGLALGIDAAAHQGALRAGGKTIAVLGSGLNNIYPTEHKTLASSIARQGAVISEYALATRPLAGHFPKRNRIISGLSQGTIVVEAAGRSGALITANYALEQGKEVFAVPGDIENPMSQGPHRLIQQGAKLVASVEDVLDEIAGWSPAGRETEKKLELSPIETQLWDTLCNDPRTIEEIAQESGLPLAQTSSNLLIMETKGVVMAFPGGRYARIS